MKYFYYAGCSLEGTAAEYDTSTRAVLRELGAELMEIEDWSCCGASAAESASYLLSMVLPARNIALASRTGVEADFGVRSQRLTEVADLFVLHTLIGHTLKHLARWVRPQKVSTPLYLLPASARIERQPLGLSLIHI